MASRWVAPLLVSAVACLAAPAAACQIPVFRYALENWQPDPYHLIVAHRGPLSPTDKELVEQLERLFRERGNSLNLSLAIVDVAETKDRVLETVLGERAQSIESPQLVLVYPFQLKKTEPSVQPPVAVEGRTAALPGQTPAPPDLATCPTGQCEFDSIPPRLAWSGKLTAEHLRQIVDSPVRQQIAAKILGGQSAIWVLLEGRDAARNDAAAATLEKTLAEMQHTLKLADAEAIKADEFYRPETQVDLKIAFSIVRVPHERGDEAVFASTLLESEPGLAAEGEPVAISIFGRGRSYYPLAGKDINAAKVEEHCRFLVGDCSCQVKRENPGVDLLFALNWDDAILHSAIKPAPPPELSGIGVIVTKDIGLEPPADAAADSPAKPSSDATTPAEPPRDERSAPAQGAMVPDVAESPPESPVVERSTPLGRVLWMSVIGAVAIGLVIVLASRKRLRTARESS